MQWLSLRLFHLYVSGDGEVLYGDIADVTERMRDVEALRMSERRFEVAMEATGLMVFELDLITRTARYSEYAQRAFGLDATVANAPEGFIEQGSVDESSTDDFRAVYEAMYRGEQRASTVVRAYLGDGSCVWNRITLMAVADAAGKATKAVGLVENVTREKEMELSLAQMVLARLNEDNQRALIGVVGDEATSGVFGRYLESDFPLYFASVDFIALLGYGTYTEFLERTGGLTRGTVAPEDAGRIEPIMLRHVPGDAYEEHYHLVRKDGSRLFVHDRGRIVWAEDGRPASVGICSIEPEPAPKGTAG